MPTNLDIPTFLAQLERQVRAAATAVGAYKKTAAVNPPSVFPPPQISFDASRVTKVEMLANENLLSRSSSTGTATTLGDIAEPGRYRWVRGGGAPYTGAFFGNPVVRSNSTSPMAVSIETNSQWIIIKGDCGAVTGSFAGYLFITVDGIPTTARPYMVQGNYDGSMGGILIEFPDASSRVIEVWTMWQIYSIVRDPSSTIGPAGDMRTRKSVYLLGDSWTGGTSQGGGWYAQSRYVQALSPWNVGINGYGGTGWTTTGTNAWDCPFGDARRVAIVTAPKPDLIVAFGSINDNSSTPAAVVAKIQTWLSDVYAASPSTKVLLIGPQYGAPATQAAMTAITAPNLAGVIDPTSWVVEEVRGPKDRNHPSPLGVEWLGMKVMRAIGQFFATGSV